MVLVRVLCWTVQVHKQDPGHTVTRRCKCIIGNVKNNINFCKNMSYKEVSEETGKQAIQFFNDQCDMFKAGVLMGNILAHFVHQLRKSLIFCSFFLFKRFSCHCVICKDFNTLSK